MKLLNIEENAVKLKRTPKAIRNLVNRRQIPFLKVGGRIMFDDEEIDQWIALSEHFTLDDLLNRRKRNDRL